MPPTQRQQAVLFGLAVSLLAGYPLSLILRANLGVVPIGAGTLLWILVIDLLIAVGLFVALRIVTADVAGRAAWLGVFFLLFGVYSIALTIASSLGWLLLPERPAVAIGYTIFCAAIATVITRPWHVRVRDPIPLLIVGAVLFGTNAAIGASRLLAFSSAANGSEWDWHGAATTLVQQATGNAAPRTAPTRDIYYIVLDGFGRADILRRLYDLDLSDFVQFLESNGFSVPAGARSNYAQTYLSLAATLNMGYLDDIARAVGPGGSDRSSLDYLVSHNAMLQLAKRAGYRVIGIGSDYGATEHIPLADVCHCNQYGSGTTEQAIFASTPLVALSLGPRAFAAHRRKVLEAFDLLEDSSSDSVRSFVFAHVVAPHPPFVFLPDGRAAEPTGLFMFEDGNHFAGSRAEYVAGYRAQTQFIVRRLRQTIEAVLSRPGPRPAIIIHGDHGPGAGLDWNSAERSDLDERMGVFAALLLPDQNDRIADTTSLVNAARTLANNYLGASLPRLDDRSFFSTWRRPFDFVAVPDEASRSLAH